MPRHYKQNIQIICHPVDFHLEVVLLVFHLVGLLDVLVVDLCIEDDLVVVLFLVVVLILVVRDLLYLVDLQVHLVVVLFILVVVLYLLLVVLLYSRPYFRFFYSWLRF